MLESFLNNLASQLITPACWLAMQEFSLAYPAPIHLQRELVHIPLHLGSQMSFLILITYFEKLLNDVIPKNVHHERKHVRLDLGQDGCSIFVCPVLQSLLNEPGSMLIATEFDHLTGDILRYESV